MPNKPQTLFLSHGGGPLPLLGDEGHRDMVGCLKNIAKQLRQPSAILVISAHWEESITTITGAQNPSLIYDYYGFPEESYHIQYPCPGEPVLAQQIHTLLGTAGIQSNLDTHRGFDHGLFVPLKIMFPKADTPCIQLSLLNNLDPAAHIKLGQALQSLDDSSLLVIGSGFSFHNIKEFFTPETDETKAKNRAFDAWLVETCSSAALNETERTQRLIDWHKAPAARYCHPREEHLLPLHVCYGLAQSPCTEVVELQILNKKASMFLWE